MGLPHPRLRAALPLVAASLCASSHAAVVVDANFDSGTFASQGLLDYSELDTPTLTPGAGTGGSTGLDFGGDGSSASSSSRTIDLAMKVSMFGLYNGNDNFAASGALNFGWTKAASDYNPFYGTGLGGDVVATDHVMVGVAFRNGNFGLAAANGGGNALSNATAFGTTVASLTSGNWYRLEGTILYDPATETFTFTDFSLDDFGATGLTEVTADVISGTGKTVVATGFGDTARLVFTTNRDRGFSVTDNYYAEAVPEPTSLLLFGVAGVIACGRRGVRR